MHPPPQANATAFFSGGNFKASLFSPPLSLDGKFNILAHSSALYPPLSFPSSLLALSVVVRSVEGVISSLLHLSDSLQRRESDDRPRAWLTKALYCFILLGASGYKSVWLTGKPISHFVLYSYTYSALSASLMMEQAFSTDGKFPVFRPWDSQLKVSIAASLILTFCVFNQMSSWKLVIPSIKRLVDGEGLSTT